MLPGAGVCDLDICEAGVLDQLDGSVAQPLRQRHKGLQLRQDLRRNHGGVHCCGCQLTLRQRNV